LKERRDRSIRGWAFAGLLIPALIALWLNPHGESLAQQRDAAPDRRAGREKGDARRREIRNGIAALRGKIELLALEHETEREILRQKLMRVPIALQEMLQLRSDALSSLDRNMPEWDAEARTAFIVVATDARGEKAAHELVEEMDVAVKTGKPEEQKKVFQKLLNGMEDWFRSGTDKEFQPLKQALVRRASDLAAMRMDLEDLERQYGEGR
jgi:hypothetical protein